MNKKFKTKGETSTLIDIRCATCGKLIINYQKDGEGPLHRCYIDRIKAPRNFSQLQYDASIKEPKALPNLACECGEILGYPMKYIDGRLAYRLERGKFRGRESKRYSSVKCQS